MTRIEFLELTVKRMHQKMLDMMDTLLPESITIEMDKDLLDAVNFKSLTSFLGVPLTFVKNRISPVTYAISMNAKKDGDSFHLDYSLPHHYLLEFGKSSSIHPKPSLNERMGEDE